MESKPVPVQTEYPPQEKKLDPSKVSATLRIPWRDKVLISTPEKLIIEGEEYDQSKQKPKPKKKR